MPLWLPPLRSGASLTRSFGMVIPHNKAIEIRNGLAAVRTGSKVSVENLLMENKYPEYNEKSLPNESTPTTQAAIIGAFDDFRELGSHYLRYYFSDGTR